jgi:hypothetical protein
VLPQKLLPCGKCKGTKRINLMITNERINIKQHPITGITHKNEPETMECSESIAEKFFCKGFMTMKQVRELEKVKPTTNNIAPKYRRSK